MRSQTFAAFLLSAALPAIVAALPTNVPNTVLPNLAPRRNAIEQFQPSAKSVAPNPDAVLAARQSEEDESNAGWQGWDAAGMDEAQGDSEEPPYVDSDEADLGYDQLDALYRRSDDDLDADEALYPEWETEAEALQRRQENDDLDTTDMDPDYSASEPETATLNRRQFDDPEDEANFGADGPDSARAFNFDDADGFEDEAFDGEDDEGLFGSDFDYVDGANSIEDQDSWSSSAFEKRQVDSYGYENPAADVADVKEISIARRHADHSTQSDQVPPSAVERRVARPFRA